MFLSHSCLETSTRPFLRFKSKRWSFRKIPVRFCIPKFFPAERKNLFTHVNKRKHGEEKAECKRESRRKTDRNTWGHSAQWRTHEKAVGPGREQPHLDQFAIREGLTAFIGLRLTWCGVRLWVGKTSWTHGQGWRKQLFSASQPARREKKKNTRNVGREMWSKRKMI